MLSRALLVALLAVALLPRALPPVLLAVAAALAAPAQAAAPSPQDRGFVLQFQRASLTAREAGALAAARAGDPGVRALGATLLRRHEAGAQELAALAEALPLPPLPDAPDGDQKAMLDGLLQAGAADFDSLFLSRLLAEQEDLIKVLSIQATTGDAPLLRDFAQRQLPVQQDLVQRARALAPGVGMPPLSASP